MLVIISPMEQRRGRPLLVQWCPNRVRPNLLDPLDEIVDDVAEHFWLITVDPVDMEAVSVITDLPQHLGQQGHAGLGPHISALIVAMAFLSP